LAGGVVVGRDRSPSAAPEPRSPVVGQQHVLIVAGALIISPSSAGCS